MGKIPKICTWVYCSIIGFFFFSTGGGIGAVGWTGGVLGVVAGISEGAGLPGGAWGGVAGGVGDDGCEGF